MDRVPGFEPGCREFKSLRARQFKLNLFKLENICKLRMSSSWEPVQARLIAGLELLKQPGFAVTLIELEKQVGGISRTIVYKNNRMDVGGHRFFLKSDLIMNW